MKFLKKILAATLSFAMIASVATTGFAMDEYETAKYEVKFDVSDTYTEGDKTYVDVSVYYGKVSGDALVAFTSGYGCSFGLKSKYDTTNATYVSYELGDSYETVSSKLTVSTRAGRDTMNFTWIGVDDQVTFDPTEALFVIKFEVLNSEAGSYSLWKSFSDLSITDENDSLISYTTNLNYPTATDIKYTIAAPAPTGPSADKAEGTAYDTYTFENLEEGSVLAGKKVLMQKEKAPVSGITEKTRFVVSDGTRTQIFGGDIWDKLNVEGEGAVKAVNVIFGLIVDAANTSTFTFDVQ